MLYFDIRSSSVHTTLCHRIEEWQNMCSNWRASLSYSCVSYWPHLSQHLKKSVSCCLGKRQHHRANSGASRTCHGSINVSFFKNKNTKIQRQIHRSMYMEPGWVNGGWKGSFYFHHIGAFAF